MSAQPLRAEYRRDFHAVTELRALLRGSNSRELDPVHFS
jgi:hypothetical protein